MANQNAINSVVATQAIMETGTSTTSFTAPGVQQYHPGHPKAWIQFDGTGTPAIGSSYNITSVTDTAVGKFTVTFTTAFSSADYCATGNSKSDGASTGFFVTQQNVAVTASTYYAATLDTGGAAKDSTRVCLAFFGDQ